MQMSEQTGQPPVCPVATRLHRTEGDREPLGDLGVGQLPEVLQSDEFPVPLG
jgi:hypothetical protein